jgi:hypothetical protein
VFTLVSRMHAFFSRKTDIVNFKLSSIFLVVDTLCTAFGDSKAVIADEVGNDFFAGHESLKPDFEFTKSHSIAVGKLSTFRCHTVDRISQYLMR